MALDGVPPQDNIPAAPPLDIPAAPSIPDAPAIEEVPMSDEDRLTLARIRKEVDMLEQTIATAKARGDTDGARLNAKRLKELWQHWDKEYSKAQRAEIIPLMLQIKNEEAFRVQLQEQTDTAIARLQRRKVELIGQEKILNDQLEEYRGIKGAKQLIADIMIRLTALPSEIEAISAEIAQEEARAAKEMAHIQENIKKFNIDLQQARNRIAPLKAFLDAIPSQALIGVGGPKAKQEGAPKVIDVGAWIEQGIIKGILLNNLRNFIVLEGEQDEMLEKYDLLGIIKKYSEFVRTRGYDEGVILGIACGYITRNYSSLTERYCPSHINPLQGSIIDHEMDELLNNLLLKLYQRFPALNDGAPKEATAGSPTFSLEIITKSLQALVQKSNKAQKKEPVLLKSPPIFIPAQKAAAPAAPSVAHVPKTTAPTTTPKHAAVQMAQINAIEALRDVAFKDQARHGVIKPLKRGTDKEVAQLAEIFELQDLVDTAIVGGSPLKSRAGLLLQGLNQQLDKDLLSPAAKKALYHLNIKLLEIEARLPKIENSSSNKGSSLLNQIHRTTKILERLQHELEISQAAAASARVDAQKAQAIAQSAQAAVPHKVVAAAPSALTTPITILRDKGVAGFEEAFKLYKNQHGKKPDMREMSAWAKGGAIPSVQMALYKDKMRRSLKA